MSEVNKSFETKNLICELCRQFHVAGWVTGTGGSISIRDGENIYMTPSGVQKERIQPDEIFTVDIKGDVTEAPVQKAGCNAPKLSDCSPLFLHAYQQRNAGEKFYLDRN
jgi:ribulose-5-phosphate 4-epimerase/fuculose-1-phosphate aldolase